MTAKPRFRVIDNNPGKKKLYEYYVSGRGCFPFDMLRYDSCWPADQESAYRVGLIGTERPGTIVSVKLRSYSEPTVDRWSSFVWSVGTEDLNERR